ncbi:hypothetical protein [Metabacillus sp. SLBN-84]
MSEKKRKRRSFWEPESKKLNDWLDAQSDLGTSLQLIIVDAIHKYGEGDVIKAHLSQRETFYDTHEPAPAPTPVRKAAPIITPVDQAQAAPSINKEQKPLALQEEALDVEDEVLLDSDEPSGEELPLDLSDLMQQEDDVLPDEDAEPEYDPVSIMMNDIGSTFSK